MNYRNDRLLSQFRNQLSELKMDISFLDDNRFNFDQKFAMYRSMRMGMDLYGVNDPSIPASEMDQIVSEQAEEVKELREKFNIDTPTYSYAQIRELNDSIATGYDITPYKDPAFSPEQMHVAKTFQQEGLPCIEQLHPEDSVDEMLSFRNDVKAAMIISEREILETAQNFYQEDALSSISPQDKLFSGYIFSKVTENVQNGLDEITKFGLDINTPLQIRDDTLLTYYTRRDVNLEAISKLIDAGADVNARATDGDVPITCLGISDYKIEEQEKILELLISKGADVNAIGENGNTVLANYLSFNNASENVVDLLIKNGADVNIQNNIGKTAVDLANEHGFGDMLEKVLKNIESPSIKEGVDPTPHITPASSQEEIIGVDLILKSGLNPTDYDKSHIEEIGKLASMLPEEQLIDIIKSNYSIEDLKGINEKITADVSQDLDNDSDVKPALSFSGDNSIRFGVPDHHSESFDKVNHDGVDKYVSRSGDVEVYRYKIDLLDITDNSVKKAIDCAIHQYGNELDLNGDKEFVDKALTHLASSDKYKDVILKEPLQQQLTILRQEREINNLKSTINELMENKEINKVVKNDKDLDTLVKSAIGDMDQKIVKNVADKEKEQTVDVPIELIKDSIQKSINNPDFNPLEQAYLQYRASNDNVVESGFDTKQIIEDFRNNKTNEKVLQAFEAINPKIIDEIRANNGVDEPGCYVPLERENPEKLSKYLSEKCDIEYSPPVEIDKDVGQEQDNDVSLER